MSSGSPYRPKPQERNPRKGVPGPVILASMVASVGVLVIGLYVISRM
ncbi:MAG: hypothetical protein Q8Q09_10455 [Deltaproteobacteria bacterium]|nr:hypothetical protein [Deltaproteobacteria bacterium]